ncbi:MAG: hypothetical protein DI598_18635 [Pseudopedobacter saltans]|uniref:GLPGLI family protein n=1 Tax=Pseudopedobacter saltans TaxID=151895 RepID=A0A2W5EHQ6_9SPHI|nr:MAG: hypothetical protein DI598_18635 [Pseudopedobacter saltans]
MNKLSLLALSCFLSSIFNIAVAQKTINNAIIEYDVKMFDPSDSTFKMSSHQKYYYAKDMLRTDSWYDDGETKTYYNGKTNLITLIEAGGGEDLYYSYSPADWRKKSLSRILKFIPAKEEKTIKGFKCKSAKVNFADGEYEIVFYTVDIVPQTEQNPTTKQDIPGFVMSREIFNKQKELIQKVAVKSFQEVAPSANTFVPDTKGRTKQDLLK